MGAKLEACRASWQRVLGDYEIIVWDRRRFDINSVAFVREACAASKWAFAADYIRLHALHEQGGIYLDADVFVQKRFDEFLRHDFFSAVEYHPSIATSPKTLKMLNADGSRKGVTPCVPGIGVQAAVMASVPGHPFLKKAMALYRGRSFGSDGPRPDTAEIAPSVLARCAEEFGFRYVNRRQYLDHDMVFLEPELVASTMNDATGGALAVHCCENSWVDRSFLRSLGRSWLGRRLRGRRTFGDILRGRY